MKKALICFLAFALVFSVTGCGAKKKVEEKIAEKFFEEVVGSDIDVDGDKVTIKGEDGEEVTFGENEWPTSELANNIPEFKDGTISSVIESSEYISITIESVGKKDFSSYLEKIKKEFLEDAYETNADEMISFSGKNDAGVTIALVHMDEMVTITIAGSQQ